MQNAKPGLSDLILLLLATMFIVCSVLNRGKEYLLCTRVFRGQKEDSRIKLFSRREKGVEMDLHKFWDVQLRRVRTMDFHGKGSAVGCEGRDLDSRTGKTCV